MPAFSTLHARKVGTIFLSLNELLIKQPCCLLGSQQPAILVTLQPPLCYHRDVMHLTWGWFGAVKVSSSLSAQWAWWLVVGQGSRPDFRCSQGVKHENLVGQDLDPGCKRDYRRLCNCPPCWNDRFIHEGVGWNTEWTGDSTTLGKTAWNIVEIGTSCIGQIIVPQNDLWMGHPNQEVYTDVQICTVFVVVCTCMHAYLLNHAPDWSH